MPATCATLLVMGQEGADRGEGLESSLSGISSVLIVQSGRKTKLFLCASVQGRVDRDAINHSEARSVDSRDPHRTASVHNMPETTDGVCCHPRGKSRELWLSQFQVLDATFGLCLTISALEGFYHRHVLLWTLGWKDNDDSQ